MRSCSRWGLPSRPRHRDRWCALTAPFHPCPQRACPLARTGRRPLAVCFLLHFPWARAPWELPSTLPCGVRTFLERRPRRPLEAEASARHPRSPGRLGTQDFVELLVDQLVGARVLLARDRAEAQHRDLGGGLTGRGVQGFQALVLDAVLARHLAHHQL